MTLGGVMLAIVGSECQVYFDVVYLYRVEGLHCNVCKVFYIVCLVVCRRHLPIRHVYLFVACYAMLWLTIEYYFWAFCQQGSVQFKNTSLTLKIIYDAVTWCDKPKAFVLSSHNWIEFVLNTSSYGKRSIINISMTGLYFTCCQRPEKFARVRQVIRLETLYIMYLYIS